METQLTEPVSPVKMQGERVISPEFRRPIIESYAVSRARPDKPQNEDDYLHDPERRLFVVADGVGGNAGGAEASRLVTGVFKRIVRAAKTIEDSVRGLKEAVRQSRIWMGKAQEFLPEEYEQMATTVVAVQIVGDNLVYTNVGDSGVVVNRGGRITRLTTEHTLADKGKPHVLTRAIGLDSDEDDLADQGIWVLEPGDRVALVSDGILGDKPAERLSDEEFATALDARFTPQEAAENLMQASRKNDDKTAVVVDCKGFEYDESEVTPIDSIPWGGNGNGNGSETVVAPVVATTPDELAALPPPPVQEAPHREKVSFKERRRRLGASVVAAGTRFNDDLQRHWEYRQARYDGMTIEEQERYRKKRMIVGVAAGVAAVAAVGLAVWWLRSRTGAEINYPSVTSKPRLTPEQQWWDNLTPEQKTWWNSDASTQWFNGYRANYGLTMMQHPELDPTSTEFYNLLGQNIEASCKFAAMLPA